MKINFKHIIPFLGILISLSFDTAGQDGEGVFKQNCAMCHKLGRKLVGPDLLGVNEKRTEEWLLKFIKSSQAFIKSGDPDAVAIFEEFNQAIMSDQAHLSDNEIKSVLSYIQDKTPSKIDSKDAKEVEEVEIIPIVYSEEDVTQGNQLFSGEKRFKNKGASCISCHNVTNDKLIAGGLLAKDLTNVYGRMGDAGLAGILGAPPFPAMAATYKENELDSTEIAQLTAFLKHADSISSNQEQKSGISFFVFGGGGGLLILLLIIGLHWNKRKKESTKKDIFSRQLRGNDSTVY